jgi:transposase
MKVEMDIYEKIRHMYTVQGIGKKTIARILGISKNTVKKYCEGESVPWIRKDYTERTRKIVNGDVQQFIQSCLEEDEKENIKKQKHTAKRIYDRLTDEMNFEGGESTIRLEVAKLKDKQPKVFVPLSFDPSEAVQIDWGEATVYFGERKVTINLFCMRLCYSCDIYVKAFLRQNEESFLEGLVSGFEYFGGVPRKVIFDNAKVAVKEGFGSVAKAQDRYLALKAHYAFELVFCNPSSGNEKGLVENLVGWFRRNVLVPLPREKDIIALNLMLRGKCLKYRLHKIKGRDATVGKMFEFERTQLLPLPKFQFDTSKTTTAKVDEFSTVRFDRNNYSVPVKYAGRDVTVKGYGQSIKILYRNMVLAEFERSYEKRSTFYQVEHYLDLIERRPRSVFNAKPVKDSLPPELLRLGERLPNGAKDMVKLLRLCVDCGTEKVFNAVRSLHNLENVSVDIIRGMVSETPRAEEVKFINDVKVSRVELTGYDKLLEGVAG